MACGAGKRGPMSADAAPSRATAVTAEKPAPAKAARARREVPTLSGPLADYLARFQAMVERLRAHPDVHIIAHAVGAPLNPARVATARRTSSAAWK